MIGQNGLFTIENENVYGFLESVKASGLPKTIGDREPEASIERAKSLANADIGSGHDCFLKGVIYQADITAGRNFWIQFQRYHFADIVSSQSTMHNLSKLTDSEIFSDYVSPLIIKHFQELLNVYKIKDENTRLTEAAMVLEKQGYSKNITKRILADDEYLFACVIHSIPQGVLLKARITTNFLQLKTMYQQRKNHKQIEWQIFCQHVKNILRGANNEEK